MVKQYKNLNNECLMLLFSIEKACGIKAGNGMVFTQKTKHREIADVKHIFAFIAITYLEYTHRQVRGFIGINYDSNINYGRRRIATIIEYNRAYRNRIYGIAVENGILGLVFDIINIVDKGNNRIKF